MRSSGWVRRWLVGAAVFAVLGGAACGDASEGVGAGDNVDFCTGYKLYDGLDEPRPDDRAEALTFAEAFQRIIKRIDERFEYRNQANKEVKLPREVQADLEVMADELERLEEAVRETDNVREVVNAFAENKTFRDADTRVTTYYRATCRG